MFVDWGMRVCTGFGEIGEQIADLGACAQVRRPVCRSGACAQERGLRARVWRDVYLGKRTVGPVAGAGGGRRGKVL